MDTNLTFNLEEINKQNFSGLEISKLIKLQQEGKSINDKTLTEISMSSWNTTSSEIRDFLEGVFGIEFSLGCDHYSYHRNKLNELIKSAKIHSTRRGQRSKLNFFEYSNLIKSKEFIKFVSDKYNENMENQEKLYKELDYLHLNNYKKSTINQQDKKKIIQKIIQYIKKQKELGTEIDYLNSNNYKESTRYQQDKEKTFQYTADSLSIIPNLADQIKKYYCMYFDVKTMESMNLKIELDETQKYIMDIVKYRFNQTGLTTYKYSSPEDVMSTNDTQVIRHFLVDINRSYFEITNSKYG